MKTTGALALSMTPGAAIFVTTLGINLLGDGLRDVLDPHRVLSSAAAARTE